VDKRGLWRKTDENASEGRTMKLDINPFTHAIKAGTKQIGLWVTLADGLAAEVVAGAGYDWVVVDTEHSPGDGLDTAAQLQAFAGTNTTALVRPAWNDAVLIKRVL
jgi:4-hydroxy-2-oxoheptanedioate aldolase